MTKTREVDLRRRGIQLWSVVRPYLPPHPHHYFAIFQRGLVHCTLLAAMRCPLSMFTLWIALVIVSPLSWVLYQDYSASS